MTRALPLFDILHRAACSAILQPAFGISLFAGLGALPLPAQTPAAPQPSSPELQEILARLSHLEQQNRELTQEVRALREELAARNEAAPVSPQPPAEQVQTPAQNTPSLEDRVAVVESRTAELAQTKVESSRKFPIRVTGMALFNAWFNSNTSSDTQYPTSAAAGVRSAGASLRQTTIGLEYRGPRALFGGKLRGSVFMDFFGGSGQPLDQLMRIRTAVIGIDWRTRSGEAGLEKPLIAQREPDSLAQVGVSPLTAAGNLWLWLPQARFEQRFTLGEHTGLRAQVAAIETRESGPYSGASYPGDTTPAVYLYENRRPGIEGRAEFYSGADRRIEAAAGFHRSDSHVAGASVPASILSFDWLARPLPSLDFTGTFFTGQNVAVLGTGALRPGYTIRWNDVIPVHSRGGWGQITWRAVPRLTFHVFAGQQKDRDEDLEAGRISRNREYGANMYFRIAPNVLVAFESSQVRTNYVRAPLRLNNHYDLSLAYLF